MGSEGSDHGHERTAVPLVPDDLPLAGHLDGTAGLEDRQRGVESDEQDLPGVELVGGVTQREVEVMGAVEEAQDVLPDHLRPVLDPQRGEVAPGWPPTAAGDSSTNTTGPAPARCASMPMAPLPANRSRDRHLLEVDEAAEHVEDRLPHPVRRGTGGGAGRSLQEPAPAARRRSHARPQVSGAARGCAPRRPTLGRSALEQEGGLGLADEEPDLVGEMGRTLEGRVLGQQRLGHPAGRLDEGTVAASQRRQLQVAAALLARAQDGALAPQLEVDLGELEPVVAALEGLEPHLPRRGSRLPENR